MEKGSFIRARLNSPKRGGMDGLYCYFTFIFLGKEKGSGTPEYDEFLG